MARKPASNPAKEPEQVISRRGRYSTTDASEWGGFINVNLSQQAKESFQSWWDTEADTFMRDADDLMGEGMKVSSSYDYENECYIVSFTGRPDAAMDFRCVMTTRASTWAEAMALAVYKHNVICKASWVDFLPNAQRKRNAWG